jgi:hypothetical protein
MSGQVNLKSEVKMIPEGMREQNFVYGTGWSAAMVAAGAVANIQIVLADDAPFMVYYYTAHVRQGIQDCEVLVQNWAGTVLITETAAGKIMFNLAIPLDAIAGNGRDVYPLPPPRLLQKSTTVAFAITSNIATRTQVFFCMHGSKLYRVV